MNMYITKAYDVLAEAKNRLKNNKWHHVVTKKGTELYKCDMPHICPTPCYLTKTIINQPLNTIVNKLWMINEDGAKENDPSVTDWAEIEKGLNYKVCTQHNKLMWPFWPRHVVFSQVKIEEKDATYLVANSVDHVKAPYDDDNYVRSFIHMSVYEYKAIDDNNTQITRITQVDPRGYIPISIVNLFATNQVDMFNRWKKLN